MIDIVGETGASSPVTMATEWKRSIRKLGATVYSREDMGKNKLWRHVKMRDKGIEKSVKKHHTGPLKLNGSYSAPANSGCGDADLVEHASNKVGHLWLIISLG